MQIKTLARFYFEESKWGVEGYVPTVEEHLHISMMTTTLSMLACASFAAMGEVATKEAFEWVTSYPTILKASSIICRVLDDINSHEVLVSTNTCFEFFSLILLLQSYREL